MQIPYGRPVIGFEPRVDVRDRLLPVLARARSPGCTHRARPVERDERDQVLELGRLHLAQRLAHPRRLELEDARSRRRARASRRSSRSSSGSVPMSSAADRARPPCRSRRGCAGRGSPSSAGRAPRRRSSRTASRPPGRRPSAAAARRRSAAARRSRRRRRGSSRRASSPSSGRARSTISLRDRVGVDGLAQLRAGLEAVLERLPGPFRDQLRDPVDDAVRDLEHAAGVADRGARRHRREGDDLRDAVAPVLLGDVVDDAVAARRPRSRCPCPACPCGAGLRKRSKSRP